MGIRTAGGRAMLGPLAALVLVAGPARAETLGEVLAARGMPAPPPLPFSVVTGELSVSEYTQRSPKFLKSEYIARA